MQYTLYDFHTSDEIERSWLISILTDYGFEGFEETSDSLKAYIPAGKISDMQIKEILYDNELHHVKYSPSHISDINWNEEWEKNFEPVSIANRLGIRAPFHDAFKTEFEIIIEPKMSFGTGHHATTASMAELMMKENFENKSVLDFGSGTGVLAIFAEKLKAEKIIAIDNEEWAYNNCLENIERNKSVKIETMLGDDSHVFNERFDIILANINRNVILKNLVKWKSLLGKKGILMVSGILLSDEKDILSEAQKNGLLAKDALRNNGWVAISFQLS
ncbi:MAG: 50S ribosomal protein L11 methyltransferase [Bacteroidota bacterium]